MKRFLRHPTGSSLGKSDAPWDYANVVDLRVDGEQVAPLSGAALVNPTVTVPDGADDSAKPATTSWVRTFMSSLQLAATGITGLATGVLSWLQAPSSENLLAALTTKTGTGLAVFNNGATLIGPILGTPASGTLTNCTGLPTAGLVNDAVTAAKLADTAVTPGDYTLGGFTVDQQGRLTAAASGTVGTSSITNLAVTTGKIADDAVTAAKLADTGVTAASYTFGGGGALTVDAQGRLTSVTSGTVIDNVTPSLTKTYSSTTIDGLLSDLETGTVTSAEVLDAVQAFIQNGGGITWSRVDDTLVPATTGLLKADGTVAGTARQELKLLNLTDPTTLTVSAYEVTVSQSAHFITASGSSATVKTISGGAAGDKLTLFVTSGKTITFQHRTTGGENILCGGSNITVAGGTTSGRSLDFTFDGNYWLAAESGSPTLADGSVVFDKIADAAVTGTANATLLVTAETTLSVIGGQSVLAVLSGDGNLVSGLDGSTINGEYTFADEITFGGGVADFPLSAAIDSYLTGETRGDILVRGASTWGRVAVGTSGKVLASDGIDPAWTTPPCVGAYREVWIGAGAMTPRTTNGAAAGTIETSSNKVMLDVLDFDTTTEEGAGFLFALPQAWNLGTVKAKVYWTAASGSGGVAWGLRARANADDDALDSAFGTEQVVTDTLLTAVDVHVTAATSALTIGNTPAAGDLLNWEITREVANGSDTIAADARLIGVMIQYLESATATASW